MRGLTLVLAACVALVAGCGASPKPRYYTLSANAPPSGPGAARDLPAIAVGAVTVPDAVDRPQIVVRTAGNELRIVEGHRWAEPLKTELPRLLADDLARATGNPRVSAHLQSASVGADYRVLVDFQRFDGTPGGEVALDALWTVRAANGDVVRAGRASARERTAADGYEALVAAYGRAVAQVAGEIARQLDGLPATKR